MAITIARAAVAVVREGRALECAVAAAANKRRALVAGFAGAGMVAQHRVVGFYGDGARRAGAKSSLDGVDFLDVFLAREGFIDADEPLEGVTVVGDAGGGIRLGAGLGHAQSGTALVEVSVN